MRIAVSAEADSGLAAAVSPHFGRCPYYTIVELEGSQIGPVQVIQNPYYQQHAPGVVPQFIHSHGVDVMLTGGMGYRAVSFFEQFGVQAVTGASGTVQQALDQFTKGELAGAAPCHDSVSHGHEETR